MCLLQGRRKLRPVLCPCLEKTTEAELLTGTSAQVSWFPDNPGDVLPPLGNRSKPTCVSGSSVSADKSERCDGEMRETEERVHTKPGPAHPMSR